MRPMPAALRHEHAPFGPTRLTLSLQVGNVQPAEAGRFAASMIPRILKKPRSSQHQGMSMLLGLFRAAEGHIYLRSDADCIVFFVCGFKQNTKNCGRGSQCHKIIKAWRWPPWWGQSARATSAQSSFSPEKEKARSHFAAVSQAYFIASLNV